MSLTILTLVLTVTLAVPFGLWCKKVMNHDVAFVNKTEAFLLDRLHISGREMLPTHEQTRRIGFAESHLSLIHI